VNCDFVAVAEECGSFRIRIQVKARPLSETPGRGRSKNYPPSVKTTLTVVSTSTGSPLSSKACSARTSQRPWADCCNMAGPADDVKIFNGAGLGDGGLQHHSAGDASGLAMGGYRGTVFCSSSMPWPTPPEMLTFLGASALTLGALFPLQRRCQ